MICRRQGRHSQRETIRYICDFSRCRLNVRLCARIHPLLRGHKYSVLSLFGSCLWLLEQNQNSCWRIWGLFRRLYLGENGKWTIKDQRNLLLQCQGKNIVTSKSSLINKSPKVCLLGICLFID